MIPEVAESPLGRNIAHAAEFHQARVVAHAVEKAVGVAFAQQVSEEIGPEHLPGRVAGIAALLVGQFSVAARSSEQAERQSSTAFRKP